MRLHNRIITVYSGTNPWSITMYVGETSQMLVICFLHCITITNWVLSANRIHLTALTCKHNRIHTQKNHIPDLHHAGYKSNG